MRRQPHASPIDRSASTSTTCAPPRTNKIIYQHRSITLFLLALSCLAGGVHVNALSFHNQNRNFNSFQTIRRGHGGGLGSRCNHPLKSNLKYHALSRIDSKVTTCSMSMSTPSPSTMAHADLAVRLDQPILAQSQRTTTNYMLKSIMAVLVSDVFKTACLAFIIAFLVTLVTKSSKRISTAFTPLFNGITHTFKRVQGKAARLKETMASSTKKEVAGVPMRFEGQDGWGVCTLANKKELGRSQYIQYDFKLPQPDNTLPLALGQKVTLCCLDSEDNVSKRSYYVSTPKNTKGYFSIVADKDLLVESAAAAKKRAKAGEGDFSRILARELDVGDEIALQPGPRTLDYKGEYLPVTDMVYFASGDGIVPVMDQVKSVLPPGSSSVKGVTVIWTNLHEKNFDIAISDLEDEYFKYSTKLAVSCIVEERGTTLENNVEVDDAVPSFNPGTMAVVSGDKIFTSAAVAVLKSKGYPETCICVLPDD